MYVQSGHTPDVKTSSHARHAGVKCALVCLSALAGASLAVADQRLPLTIAAAEDLALRDEPGEASLRLQALALREQAVAADQLPDPVMRLGLANYPVQSGGFSTEGMTQAQLGIRQEIPRRAVRSSRADRLQHLASDLDSNAEARARDVLAATRVRWLDYFYWQRSIEILDESRRLFEDLAEITRSQYSVGRKSQYDVLQAELELRRLDVRLIAANRSMAAAQASLSEWVGEDAYRPVATALPAWSELPPVSVMQERLRTHPLLLAADAQIAAQKSAVMLADAKKKPGWALDLGYGHRDGLLPSGEPRSDFVSFSVMVELPFFRKNRQDRELSAALASRSAAEATRRKLAAELNSRLLSHHAAWTHLTQQIALYETRILNMSATSAEAALLAYRSDAGDFSDVLHSTVSDLETRLDFVRLQVEGAKAYATLAHLGGLSR